MILGCIRMYRRFAPQLRGKRFELQGRWLQRWWRWWGMRSGTWYLWRLVRLLPLVCFRPFEPPVNVIERRNV